MIKRLNKKGKILMPEAIFIFLNIVFMVVLLAFVYRAGSGALAYEQTSCKEIALILDSFEKGMKFELDFSEEAAVARGNKKLNLNQMVMIKDNFIIISLSNSGGYSMKYFSDYDFKISFSEDYNLLILEENEDE